MILTSELTVLGAWSTQVAEFRVVSACVCGRYEEEVV